MTAHSHVVEWRTASPLWSLALTDPAPNRFFEPVLLRFAADDFHVALEESLKRQQPPLDSLVARREDWRTPGAGWQEQADVAAEERPLKLYQPYHGRFYLVAAALICRIPGLPDRAIDPEGSERVFYLIRRLAPGGEEAWAPGEKGGEWQPVLPDQVHPAEEQLTLFPVKYTEGKQPRRLWAGYLPLPRFAAAAAPAPAAAGGAAGVDPVTWFESRVVTPMGLLPSVPGDEPAAALSALLLLELGGFVQRYLPRTWTEVESGTCEVPLLGEWAGALVEAMANRDAILGGDRGAPAFDLRPDITAERLGGFKAQVEALLAARAAPAEAREAHRYVARCVYERPRGKSVEYKISAPTQPFQIAGFGDPDAPGRLVPKPERKPLKYGVQWQIPLPLWEKAAADSRPDRVGQPAILRFATDKFMPELKAALAEEPARLDHLIARPEKQDAERVGWQAEAELAREKQELKLYQAVHERFYLAAASLVCQLPGMPEKQPDPGNDEIVCCVLRRLVPLGAGESTQEYGWDAVPPQMGWRPVPPGRLLPGEEQLACFPLTYKDGLVDRHIWATYLPITVRDQPKAVHELAPPPTEQEQINLLESRVITPLRRLAENAGQAEDQAKEASTGALLSLAAWLHLNLSAIWADVETGDPAKAGGNAAGVPFLVKWTAALNGVWANRRALVADEPDAPAYNLQGSVTAAEADALDASLKELLHKAGPPPGLPGEPQVPRLENEKEDRYVVRFVYGRPAAPPEEKWLISPPSRPFVMADFYDKDAPKQMPQVWLPLLKLLMPPKE